VAGDLAQLVLSNKIEAARRTAISPKPGKLVTLAEGIRIGRTGWPEAGVALEFEILRHAVHQTHGCGVGRLLNVVRVDAKSGADAWLGKVHVLELIGHEQAKRCYAWIERVSPATQVLHAALHEGDIASAEQAVRSRLGERRRKKK
jgi:hypothetical protein